MKKLLILENDSEHQGLPDMVQNILDENKGLEIEPWFWFSNDMWQNPKESAERFVKAMADPETWAFTYPSFAGLGNEFEGKLEMFLRLKKAGIKIRLIVAYCPDFYWYVVDWLYDVGAYLGADRQKAKEIEKLKEALEYHDIYWAPYMELSWEENSLQTQIKRLTWDLIKVNYYGKKEKVRIKGKNFVAEVSGIRYNEYKKIPEVTVWEPLSKTSNTIKTYPLSDLERLEQQPKKEKKVVDPNDISKGRLTLERLKDWANSEFKRLGIEKYEVTAIERTRYSRHEYEGGAARLVFRVEHVLKIGVPSNFLCFHSLAELQDAMREGYELYLKTDHFGLIANMTVDFKKKN